MTKDAPNEPGGVGDSSYWRSILTGEHRGLQFYERWFHRVPKAPRCKLCHAPFEGPFSAVFRLLGFSRWRLNQQLCRWCISSLEHHSGGAEVPVSVLYADIRGSTSLAESMGPGEFTQTLDPFYGLVTRAVDGEEGVIDHMAGDGIMAFWVPGFVGADHPRRAVAAGRQIIDGLAAGPSGQPIPAGVGVHTGVGYVGVVGVVGARDFTVLGDVPNTVARLASNAGVGELVLSDQITASADVPTTDLERRTLQLRGKADPFPVWVDHGAAQRPGDGSHDASNSL